MMEILKTMERLKNEFTNGSKKSAVLTHEWTDTEQDESLMKAFPDGNVISGLPGAPQEMNSESRFCEDIYSKPVRAGKRTYFFDVKATRGNELYLTITESKKRFEPDGQFHFEKHKMFLYREDFEKFVEGLQEVISFIADNQAEESDDEYAPNHPGQ